jgi:hypothetical protein
MSDFAQILAPCRARKSTYSTIHMAAVECKAAMCMVGLVDLRARHSAYIRAKKGYFTTYRMLKDASRLKPSVLLVTPTTGNMIDLRFCEGYEVGDTDVLHGVIDDTQYNAIFCMKEEDYVMEIMSTSGSNCPPIREQMKARRTIVDGSKVQFEYIEPIANHFDY